ncbi:MAG TPA: PAS domain S-box protein [Candidatus Methanoperedens sp.]
MVEISDSEIRKLKAHLVEQENNANKTKKKLELDFIGCRRAERMMTRLNECFLMFGTDPLENINMLTALYGELIGATCSLYNRLDKGMLCSWGKWMAPKDYKSVDWPDGHICYDIIKHGRNEITIIRNLQETDYARTDPNVTAYKLKTYIGFPVKFMDTNVGSLCAVFQDDFIPAEIDNKFMGIIASAIGIEEKRKYVDEELKRSEELFRTSIENMLDAFGVYSSIRDASGRIIDFRVEYVNSAACRSNMLTKEEQVGKTMRKILPPHQEFELFEEYCRVVETGKSFIKELLLYEDGKEKRLRKGFDVRVAKHGDGFVASWHDITDRKKVEETLRDSEERYRRFVEISPDGIMIHNTNELTYSNKAGANILGAENPGQVIGMKLFEFIHPDYHEIVKKRIENEKEGKIAPLLESKWIKLDGTPVDVEVAAIPIFYKGRVEIHSIVRDITERKLVEQKIKNSLKEKEILLKEVHHRVKNNLQVISSLLFLQSKKVEDKHSLEVFNEGQNRIRSMVLVHEQLYQSGDMANINFDKYIRDIAQSLALSYGSKPVTINVHAEGMYLGIDQAIPCGLIINELISNALKHAFPQGRKGQLDIDFKIDDSHYLILTAKDNGIGFPMNLDFQNTSSLGLQIINKLVKQLKGTIELESNNGTIFRIAFPDQDRDYTGMGK